MSKFVGAVKWTLGLGLPVLSFVAVSSALVGATAGYLVAALVGATAGYLVAALVGATAYPLLPGVWHLVGELRRRRRAGADKATLTGLDRWLLRSWIVATVLIAGVWLALGNESTRSDGPRAGGHARTHRPPPGPRPGPAFFIWAVLSYP